MPTKVNKTIDLDVQGMTCASCAARIQKKLNKVEGIKASVNYATEKAKVIVQENIKAEDLIKIVEAAGYGASLARREKPKKDQQDVLRPRMIASIVVAVMVIPVSMIPAMQFLGWQWCSLVMATVIVFWAGYPFHKAAIVNLRHGATTMDTLISMGTMAAYLWSLYAIFLGKAGEIGLKHKFEFVLARHDATANVYFEAAIGIITFLLIGRYIESKSKKEAGAALKALLEMGAKDVIVLKDGKEKLIPINELLVGDKFIVKPGSKVAADGVVIEGSSAVDASLITGESLPVDVSIGDKIIGGTVNANGVLIVEANAVGADTELAHIGRLVEEAQTGKSDVQRLADKISTVFVPLVLLISLATLITWLTLGASFNFAFTSAVAVIIIACPCALGLATPTALLVGTGRGAQLGIVIKGAEVLETARNIDTIVLDKTGTITSGQMSISHLSPALGFTEEELLKYAKAVEACSEHPIARAIADNQRQKVSQFKSIPGFGVQGILDGKRILAGKREFLTKAGIEVPEGQIADETAISIWVGIDNIYLGRIDIADELKPTSKEAIQQFNILGLKTILLSGDSERTAQAVAREVGISEARGGVLPADKVHAVTELQRSGAKVAMVGDGVNDAAALAQADLGLAMGAGADVAIAASDITLMRSDLLLAAEAIRLSRATLRTIKMNLFWAFIYNICAIPLAALGFLNPMFAGAGMAFSSVLVVLNSLRLRTYR